MKHITFIGLLLAFSVQLKAQDCKVLLASISDSHSGGCKKGLAHGEGKSSGEDFYEGNFRKGLPDGIGKYTWKNGQAYFGEFNKGLKEGKGELSFFINGKDSTTVGYWRDDVYVGEILLPDYKINQVRNTDNVRITQTSKVGNTVEINLMRMGSKNMDVSNLQSENTGGPPGVARDGSVQFEVSEFPFTAGVTYTTTNKLKTSSIDVIVRFTINYPGVWRVDITN